MAKARQTAYKGIANRAGWRLAAAKAGGGEMQRRRMLYGWHGESGGLYDIPWRL